MTARDRLVVLVLAAAALCAGAWFALIAPQRKEAQDLGDQIAVAREQLDAANQSAAAAEQAKARYRTDYATVARLGKAVPSDDDVPSLVFQLESAADRLGVDFRAIKLESSGTAAATAAPPVAQAAAVAQAGGSATDPAKGGTTPASGTATPPASGTAAPAAGGTAAQAAPAAGAAATPAAPTQAAAAALPPGATVGPAGFPTMPFSFTFDGSFFGMQKFLRALDRFTATQDGSLVVRGRLLTIDGVALTAGRKGFPQVKASVRATAYLLPEGQEATAGATATAPAPVSTAAPAAPATGGGTATPAPTATATGIR